MAVVLIVLGTALLGFRGLGALGVADFSSWRVSARYALAVMLLFTGSAHFTSIKEVLVRMVPPWVPYPRFTIFVTGILEILGAIGLLIPRFQRPAGIALILFLIAVLPANIYAAQTGILLGGQPATPVWIRVPIQLMFIALAWWSTQPAVR